MAQSVKIQDTNMANYGTKEHKEMRTAAAAKEEQWVDVGQSVGILVWRIEKFKVVPWPKPQYGQFYDGDSYIILNTYKDADDKLKHNVHFWLGANTTQDEAGSAAYKTVELDDYLGQLPVQYREVQGVESKCFLNLFDKITILSGGVDTGFNHVEPDKYDPRLLKVNGKCKKIQVYQVKLELNSLNNTDVFILDGGVKLYQYNGDKSNVWEKNKANGIIDQLQDDRSIDNNSTCIIDGFNDNSGGMVDEFWDYFNGKPNTTPPDIAVNDEKQQNDYYQNVNNVSIHQINDDNGNVSINKIVDNKNDFQLSLLDSNDCFIVDLGYSIYIWIGKGSTKNEKKESMKYAIKYCQNTGRTTNIPIVRVNEGNETAEFLDAFNNGASNDNNNDDDIDMSNLKRAWNFSMTVDPKKRVIVISILDKVSNLNWKKEIGKNELGGKNPIMEYHKISDCVNNGDDIIYDYNGNGPVNITIKKDNNVYNFECPQV